MSIMQQHAKKNAAAVKAWNDKYLVGQNVKVKLDNGGIHLGLTQSPAWLLGGHSAVILISGISGGFKLDRVEAV